jgi:hypothetical protein
VRLDRDSRGFALSLDLLLAIIPITLLLGMVAADMDNVMYQIQDTIFQSSTERVAADTVNSLLQTSGDPVNWEQTGTANVVGLAYYDPLKGSPVKGTISSRKLAALTEPHVTSLTGDEYGFYLNISTTDNVTIKNLSTGNLTAPSSNATNIIKVERMARYSKLEVVSKIEGVIRGSGAIRPYTNPPNQFQTSNSSLQTNDYWILVDNHGFNTANITVNNGTMYMGPSNISTPTKIDSGLLKSDAANKAYNNTVTIMAGSSPGTWMDLYIIEVPKTTPSGDITLANLQPKSCRFQFYLWIK